MIIDNTQIIKRIKMAFYPGAVLMAVAALVFIFTDKDLYALIAGGILVLWFLAFQFADFQFVYFTVEEGKIILRYYPAVKFGRKNYSSIEFPVSILHDYFFENSVFGLVKDLILVVKTKRGIAEYPPVSMAAVTRAEREKIGQTLRELLNR